MAWGVHIDHVAQQRAVESFGGGDRVRKSAEREGLQQRVLHPRLAGEVEQLVAHRAVVLRTLQDDVDGGVAQPKSVGGGQGVRWTGEDEVESEAAIGVGAHLRRADLGDVAEDSRLFVVGERHRDVGSRRAVGAHHPAIDRDAAAGAGLH